MPLLKKGSFGPDPWTRVDDEAPLPADRPVIVSLARLLGEADAAFFERSHSVGVFLQAGDDVEALADYLGRLGLIALEFPKFSDGRAFSSARILRQQHRFAGEIRAVGDVLVDQYQFMLRCGFDAFEIAEGRPLQSWKKAQVAMTLAYQSDDAEPSGTGGPAQSIFEARRRAHASLAAE